MKVFVITLFGYTDAIRWGVCTVDGVQRQYHLDLITGRLTLSVHRGQWMPKPDTNPERIEAVKSAVYEKMQSRGWRPRQMAA